jgi:TRAP-type C4-dicarboxylate transport system permease small subunit
VDGHYPLPIHRFVYQRTFILEKPPAIAAMIRKFIVPAIFILTGAMFLLIFTQVLLRYVFLKPLSWSEEAARYLMIWIICMAASEAYARGEHVGVLFLQNSIAPNKQKWLKVFIHGAVSILMAVIIYFGFDLSFSLSDQKSPALDLPMTWSYLALPVGALLMLVQSAAFMFQEIKAQPMEKAADVSDQSRDAGEA